MGKTGRPAGVFQQVDGYSGRIFKYEHGLPDEPAKRIMMPCKKWLLLFASFYFPCITGYCQQRALQFSSAYTALHTDCMMDAGQADEVSGDPVAHCRGYGAFRIAIAYSISSATLSVVDSIGTEIAVLGTEYSGIGMHREVVEWRLAAGKPFAVLFRVGTYGHAAGSDRYYTSDNRQGSRIIVKGLPPYSNIDFAMDGDVSNAFAAARAAADKLYKP